MCFSMKLYTVACDYVAYVVESAEGIARVDNFLDSSARGDTCIESGLRIEVVCHGMANNRCRSTTLSVQPNQ